MNTRKINTTLVAVAVAAFAGHVEMSLYPSVAEAAGSSVAVKVTKLHMYENGYAVVEVSAKSGNPSCVLTPTFEKAYDFDATTARGQATFSLLLAAKLSGQDVSIVGLTTNTCSSGFTNIEDLRYAVIE